MTEKALERSKVVRLTRFPPPRRRLEEIRTVVKQYAEITHSPQGGPPSSLDGGGATFDFAVEGVSLANQVFDFAH